MNITTLCLITSNSASLSAIFSPASHYSYNQFSLQNSHFTKFFMPVLLSHSKISNLNFHSNSFKNFLISPLTLNSEVYLIKGQEFSSTTSPFEPQLDSTNTTITNCLFENCVSTGNGGAISVSMNTALSVVGTIFDSCQGKDKGGAIFISSDGNAGLVSSVYSQYCCFSKCSLSGSDTSGSAVLAYSAKLELYFSSTNLCPGTGNTCSGAQFDLLATNVQSNNVNTSNGYSTYCSSIEYRSASTGFFSYQTIYKCFGGFIVAFSNTIATDLVVSYTNIVNCELIPNGNYVRLAIIHQSGGQNSLTNFYIFDCDLHHEVSVTFLTAVISVANSGGVESNGQVAADYFVTDFNQGDMISDHSANKITLGSNNQYGDTSKITYDIEQLNLGECAGAIIAPGRAPTEGFSPSEAFTLSASFTKKIESENSSENENSSGSSSVVNSGNSSSGNSDVEGESINSSDDGNSDDEIDDDDDGEKKGLSSGELAAAISVPIIVAAVILAILLILFFLAKNKKKVANEEGEEKNEENELEDKFHVDDDDNLN
ncbi:hypothetical protein TRFO_05301 [Tritrichomonas foetus]|uniref:Uncharacterized protein n=1 Tax=Tritrichomonas foetus TaxID=1144522 RepID=A0A1J4K6U7_9EUKA|nr:hypothetical protein TRFO_05301 [Tritrichomonas foetus]|eukprot:OHT07087.1 hypothetical protein TRFO_05301 [Tritrichomonas foetus]